MGNLIELTGVPASGKSTFIKRNNLKVVTVGSLFPSLNDLPRFLSRFLGELVLFVEGLSKMPFKDVLFYFHISMNEKVDLIYKLNIFRNTVRKFGVFFLCQKISVKGDLYIDEGLSHIPFNFLSTEFSTLEVKLGHYLKEIDVQLVESPREAVIVERLMERGHTRLKFLKIGNFIKNNMSVENELLLRYPFLCHSFNKVEIG